MKRFTCILIAAGAAVSLSLAGAGAASASANRLGQSASSAATAIRAAAASPADTVEGCGIIAQLGASTPQYSYPIIYQDPEGPTVPSVEFVLPILDISAEFCNIDINNGGRFQIYWAGGDGVGPGCLAVNNSETEPTPGGTHPYIIDIDTPGACDQDGGQGYAWDQWTAKKIGEKDGFTAWEFVNYFNNQCMYYYPQQDSVPTYTTCLSGDGFEWFAWNDSGL
jgi:hypothetical protein